jgi:hypothetical protein
MESKLLLLTLQILLGGLVFVGLSVLFRVEALKEGLALLNSAKTKKRSE